MTYTITDLDTGKDILIFTEINKSACRYADNTYTSVYGIDRRVDSEYEIGNERHKVWLKAFDDRYKSLIINPYQN